MKTVLGDISAKEVNSALCHEHICCYSEYIRMMLDNDYFDLITLEEKAVATLKDLKSKYGLNLFVDCTPINIGRDINLLKRVSEKSGVHIVCSTGFYYTDEPVLYNNSAELLAEYMIKDAKNINAGIIKAAIENEALGEFNIKLFTASAIAQKELNLPLVIHTNANNKNALKVLDILIKNGVNPECITIGHLSDTENIEYILEVAKSGCYIGLDRMYGITSDEYVSKKITTILQLADAGFEDKILLSHDEQFFNGFESTPAIKENTRFSYIFEYICPRIEQTLFERIIRQNPINMLNALSKKG